MNPLNCSLSSSTSKASFWVYSKVIYFLWWGGCFRSKFKAWHMTLALMPVMSVWVYANKSWLVLRVWMSSSKNSEERFCLILVLRSCMVSSKTTSSLSSTGTRLLSSCTHRSNSSSSGVVDSYGSEDLTIMMGLLNKNIFHCWASF